MSILLTDEEIYQVVWEIDEIGEDVKDFIKKKWYRSSECIQGKNTAKAQLKRVAESGNEICNDHNQFKRLCFHWWLELEKEAEVE